MWRKDSYVTNGLRDFVERGEAWALMKELEAAGEKVQSVHTVFSAPAVPSGTGQTSTELEVQPRHSLVGRGQGRGGALGLLPTDPLLHQVSFAVRIVPSPDWFVGVDSLDLCEGGRWKEQASLDLYPHDAGTDSGFTFSSPNFATIPQDTVTEVSGQGGRAGPWAPADGPAPGATVSWGAVPAGRWPHCREQSETWDPAGPSWPASQPPVKGCRSPGLAGALPHGVLAEPVLPPWPAGGHGEPSPGFRERPGECGRLSWVWALLR